MGVCYTSASTSAAAVADVVADVYQTPIFIVAAVADINLRRISQLNKNVCYGCYTKNGRLLGTSTYKSDGSRIFASDVTCCTLLSWLKTF